MRPWVGGLAFAAANAAAALMLQRHGLEYGKALGVVVFFYLFLLPCALMAACFVAPFLGGVTAMALAILAAAWLAWCNVTASGVAPELQDPATCFDRQGAHPC